MKELKILCSTAALGFGFPEESFKEGLRREPDLIGIDAYMLENHDDISISEFDPAAAIKITTATRPPL